MIKSADGDLALEAPSAPISPDIVNQHAEQAAAALADRDADALLVFRRTNILGFCGVPMEPTDRLVCGLITREGQIAFVVPAFEAGVAGNLPPGSVLITWDEHEDPYEATASAAKKLGVNRRRIILDKYTWASSQQRFADVLPDAVVDIDTDLIDSIRISKSAAEISAMRDACADTGRIYPLIGNRLRAGITELEMRRDVIGQLERMGLRPFGELIQGGENASIPHHPTSNRAFRNGDAVIVDFVCTRSGYLGDMTRTFAVGDVGPETLRAYRAVRDAQSAAIAAIRPGITCGAIDAAARNVIDRAGFGDYFVHRLGHGIGMDVHEPPYFVSGSQQRLEPGMCLTVEPGVYLPGQFGIRIEDVIAVTPGGCEVLSAGIPTDVSQKFT